MESYINSKNYNYNYQDNMKQIKIELNEAPSFIQDEIKLYEYNFRKINEELSNGKFEMGKFDNTFYTKIDK